MIDTEGLVLVAMMSGGDYLPTGIPDYGPKIAVEVEVQSPGSFNGADV